MEHLRRDGRSEDPERCGSSPSASLDNERGSPRYSLNVAFHETSVQEHRWGVAGLVAVAEPSTGPAWKRPPALVHAGPSLRGSRPCGMLTALSPVLSRVLFGMGQAKPFPAPFLGNEWDESEKSGRRGVSRSQGARTKGWGYRPPPRWEKGRAWL